MGSIEVVATLADGVRRQVYAAVVAAGGPVGRDEIAGAVGIGRTLAAHHLDKLADAGLLDVSFARRNGRTGPGAGRPAKLYARSSIEVQVSVPDRDYRGLAGLLADVVEEAGLEPALYAAARRLGEARAQHDPPAVDPIAVLADLGYAPVRDGDTVRLRNCPFDAVARSHPPVVCGANLELIQGALGDLAEARLDPRPGHCCVVVHCKNNLC